MAINIGSNIIMMMIRMIMIKIIKKIYLTWMPHWPVKNKKKNIIIIHLSNISNIIELKINYNTWIYGWITTATTTTASKIMFSSIISINFHFHYQNDSFLFLSFILLLLFRAIILKKVFFQVFFLDNLLRNDYYFGCCPKIWLWLLLLMLLCCN